MPESMMIAEAGGRLKVTGSSRAIVAAGPIPGRTPIRVPTKQPTRQRARFKGVIAMLNPVSILEKMSMFQNLSKGKGIGIFSQTWNR